MLENSQNLSTPVFDQLERRNPTARRKKVLCLAELLTLLSQCAILPIAGDHGLPVVTGRPSSIWMKQEMTT